MNKHTVGGVGEFWITNDYSFSFKGIPHNDLKNTPLEDYRRCNDPIPSPGIKNTFNFHLITGYFFKLIDVPVAFKIEAQIMFMFRLDDPENFQFNAKNEKWVKLLKKMLMETEDMIDTFAGLTPILDGKLKRLSPTELHDHAIGLMPKKS